jgi:hypothetical protein
VTRTDDELTTARARLLAALDRSDAAPLAEPAAQLRAYAHQTRVAAA